jgi:hypothetical protein
MRALQVIEGWRANCACCLCRAAMTRPRITADVSPVCSALMSRNITFGTSMWRSMRN